MNNKEKILIALLSSLLIACSDADVTESGANEVVDKQAVQTESTAPKQDFLFHEMKQSLDEAKAARDLMNKKHAEMNESF